MDDKYHVRWPQRRGGEAYAHVYGGQVVWSKLKGATEFKLEEGKIFILQFTNSLLLELVEV